jgi:hypothetical protein
MLLQFENGEHCAPEVLGDLSATVGCKNIALELGKLKGRCNCYAVGHWQGSVKNKNNNHLMERTG